ncbi:MAG: hypothetical protein MK108_10975 [Mariniblastus sp.]|nr:hypothetical protein [Mariniblastus sp.]
MIAYPTSKNPRRGDPSSSSPANNGPARWLLPICAVISGCFVMSIMMTMGCGFQAQASGISDGGSSWWRKSDDPIPGIDNAAISVITLYSGPIEESLPFVVWSDMSSRRGAGGTDHQVLSNGKPTRGASYTGHHATKGKENMAFHAETTDGVTGTIQFGERTYDFANGRLFLISTQQESAEILQLPIDTANMSTDMEKLLEFAEANPAIEAFFQHRKPAREESP